MDAYLQSRGPSGGCYYTVDGSPRALCKSSVLAKHMRGRLRRPQRMTLAVADNLHLSLSLKHPIVRIYLAALSIEMIIEDLHRSRASYAAAYSPSPAHASFFHAVIGAPGLLPS